MNKKMILGSIALLATTTLGVFAGVSNNLEDVTKGSTIRGITTSADATGFAKVTYNTESGYQLHAVLQGLTDPKGDDFYEGWVVRQSPFAFISTGELEKDSDGKWHNTYSSSVDYSDYDLYVLTLEPNDGNDAPADHIVEGATTIVESFMKKPSHEEKTDKHTELRSKIKKALSGFSESKKQKLANKVTKLQAQLPTLKISESKRKYYNDILNIISETIEELK